MNRKTLAALASIACTAGTLLLSTPVLAAGAPVAMIKVSDLHIHTREGSAELSRRITQAARQICRSTELDLRLESRALCYSSVRAEALDKVKLNQPR